MKRLINSGMVTLIVCGLFLYTAAHVIVFVAVALDALVDENILVSLARGVAFAILYPLIANIWAEQVKSFIKSLKSYRQERIE